MGNSSNIVVLGGTFDPPHLGHMALAEQAQWHCDAKAVWMVPAAQQPLRSGPQASPLARTRMLEGAIEAQRDWKVVPDEVDRGAPSYTFETAQDFARRGVSETLWWAMGADVARQINAWHRYRELLAIINVVIANRAHEPAMPDAEARALGFDPSRTKIISIESPPVSATMVREAVAAGRGITDLVPPAVAGIIASEGLYLI